MNELEIIRQQLAAERKHFAEVSQACESAIAHGSFKPGSDFARACADYFAFALTRVNADASRTLAPQLDAIRAAEGTRGREFLLAFDTESRRYFDSLSARLIPGVPITEWRAVSRIDADCIVAERARYADVKAALPPGVTLSIGAGK